MNPKTPIISTLISVFSLLLFSHCTHKNVSTEYEESRETLGYYSDYFVFIADDGGTPLVVPLDINWNLHTAGFDVEYKSWIGTDNDWPIEYYKNSIPSEVSEHPNESFDHPNAKTFQFDSKVQSISATIENNKVDLFIPEKSQWVVPNLESEFPTYGFKTTVRLNGLTRSGWMLYERIRFDDLKSFGGFAAFFWMPIVIDGNLYQFIDHKGEKTAVRWITENGMIKAEALPRFRFNILETESDATSKRNEIPTTVQILVPEWNIDISLMSTGEQVGYGSEFPKGLAYFRQSLLQSTSISRDNGYGMMELILGDN